MLSLLHVIRISSFLGILTLAACGGGSIEEGPPEGWNTDGARWWAEGVDTSVAFRSMASLEDLGVAAAEERYAANESVAASSEFAGEYLVRGVQRFLLPLYRIQPEVIDSLFRQHILPELGEATVEVSLEQEIQERGEDAYETLVTYHFREPRPLLELGTDVEVRYPDSLRSEGIGGSARMQVYLGPEGEPLAVMLREGAHPVLDREAMRVASRMRWEPIKVAAGDEWRPLHGWTRYVLTFTAE